MSLKAMTANRLSDGIAVWLSPTGRWTERVHDARVERDEVGHAALEAIGAAETKKSQVVEAALIDVHLEDGQPVPSKFKERIRALGPTVRLDLGKQSEPQHRLGKVA